MGADIDTLEVKSTKVSAVQKEFKAYQKEAAYESGNSYSGRLNMCRGLEFTNRTFDSYDEAYTYLEAKVQKWDNALAAEFKTKTGERHTLIVGLCSC